MWKVVPGILLSLLPRPWRVVFAIPPETVPWVSAAIIGGIVESLFAVVGLVYWYSHSVTTWAARALDSALHNGPTADYDPHVLGFAAFVIWLIHPLTWLLASFFLEGLLRLVAAISSGEILPTWVLAAAHWCYCKSAQKPTEDDRAVTAGGREGPGSFVRAAKLAVKSARLPQLPDELVARTEDAGSILEISSSHAKAEWAPPRIVRVDGDYYRLESVADGRRPRPFVYRLRRLPAGVPGRSVLLYTSPPDRTGTPKRP